MQKRDVADGSPATPYNLPVMKCGSCLHFNSVPHSSKKGEVCSKIGVREQGTAPSCFTPNVQELCVTSELLVQATALMALPRTARRVLAALMSVDQKKLKFGTKIYFRPIGKDYMSNYRSGFVLGYSSMGDIMVVGDRDPNKRGNAFVALLKDEDGVLTPAEWREKRARLLEQNLINDPDLSRSFIKKTVLDDYEPPSMDTAPEHWFRKAKDDEVDEHGNLIKKKKAVVREVEFPKE